MYQNGWSYITWHHMARTKQFLMYQKLPLFVQMKLKGIKFLQL